MSHALNNHTCSTDRKPKLATWCWLLLALAALALAGLTAAQKGKPLAAKDITDLLEGNVPSSEIAQVVAENGISFRMSDELESQFRKAGATDELVEALKKASKPQDAPPSAPSTGTLKIQSQPGEAQVDVNDVPRGMTSPEGELRLAGLAPGSYRLRVARTGYKTWENTITVTAGETVTPFVTLEKENLTPTVTLDTDRSSIESGQSVYLRWTSVNATDVDIEPNVGKVTLSGATSVSPRDSTTYTLTAIGPGGIKTATTYVSVTAPPPVVRPVVGNLPGFPIPGASFKEIKFFESGYTPPDLGARTYQVQFSHRSSRFINWELHITCPPPTTRVNFTVYATWYDPSGIVFANQTVPAQADPGRSEPVCNSGRGWQRAGMWRKGMYRVDLYVNGSHIGSGTFSVY
jgi:hypothetical protein